ncbi:hypothetical protein NLM33_39755 [Bradyrhizobium sp. CCGUVB1N3]|uniref:hypothetical protein n=1 Tax=Bradyrhizobium sp. CCGUVB1N3 TaxID=2949629 RepID=UPI0020B2AC22|nr:hypothetical protein [Bradyrhizobium sp. CCGUVB1N3]MCP3476357.1 hypothetical protein [Bradyrhizobium sp. CCGUVB1N3]
MHRQRRALKLRKSLADRKSRAPSIRRIARIYGSIQKRIAQLAYRDSFYAIWAYAQYLQLPDFKIPSDIEVEPALLAASMPQALLAEWTLEQIAREVIQHGHDTNLEARRLRQWSTLAEVANGLRELEGDIYACLVGPKKIHLEMMRVSHRQFVWQQQYPNWRYIIRYYKLFNTANIAAHAVRAVGLTVEHIFMIGMAYLGMFLDRPFVVKDIKIEIPELTRGCYEPAASLATFLSMMHAKAMR